MASNWENMDEDKETKEKMIMEKYGAMKEMLSENKWPSMNFNDAGKLENKGSKYIFPEAPNPQAQFYQQKITDGDWHGIPGLIESFVVGSYHTMAGVEWKIIDRDYDVVTKSVVIRFVNLSHPDHSKGKIPNSFKIKKDGTLGGSITGSFKSDKVLQNDETPPCERDKLFENIGK